MKTEGRLAAIDVGRRRVGIARTDLLQLSPNTVGTFEPDEAIDELVRQVEEEGVTGIVTGWPLTPDGREGEATQMVESFVRRLKKKLPDCPIR
ncbi:MAG: RuvX/YqgF family protein, partial [Balneolaceae bacterium]